MAYMLTKIKKLLSVSTLKSLSDVRTLGLVVFAGIALLVTWSGIKVVQTNYDLQKQIAAMQQENDNLRLGNANAALRNQFLETDTYLELAARKQYNKALPGEKLLIVPKSVAMSHTVEVQATEKQETSPDMVDETGPWYERNFNAWMEFLFRSKQV